METEYKAMAMAIVNKEVDPATGNPYTAPHNGNIFETAEQQFDMLLWQLGQEQKTNQQLVSDANARVAECNTARNNAYAGAEGVDARLTASNAARVQHDGCRTNENAAIEDRKGSCEKFVEEKYCEMHEDDYNYFAASDPGQHELLPQKLLNTIANAGECKDDLAQEGVVNQNCDDKQKSFELKFCLYDQKLTSTCRTLDSCYSEKIEERKTVVESIQELEKNQKVVYKMVQKVKCYVDKMKTKFTTLAKSDIQECENRDPSTTTLDIDYPAADKKLPCDLSLLANGAPGDSTWTAAEYRELHHKHHGETYAGYGSEQISKIEAIVEC